MSHVFTTQIVSRVLVLWATPLVLAMQIVFGCIDFARTLEMVHLNLQAVREENFGKFHGSGHPMVASQSAAPTSMCGTILVSVGRHHSPRSIEAKPLQVGLGAHVLVLCPTCHVLAVGARSHASVMQVVLHALAC